jgi:methylated-DNA-[protein]-cysteine S-methyltransferase
LGSTVPEPDCWHSRFDTGIGVLTIAREPAGISGLYFPGHWHLPAMGSLGAERSDGFDDAIAQLGEYLDGARRIFDVALAPRGTPFQRRVWACIDAIEYGATTSYGAIADDLGDATPREVGAAVARNPLSIFVPCHRVVGADGDLVGYAGGLERKRFLLELEGAIDTVGSPQRLW